MDGIELLPLPDWMENFYIPSDSFDTVDGVLLFDRMQEYARDCVISTMAERDAEIKKLTNELNRVECGLLEQIEFHVEQVEALEAALEEYKTKESFDK